MNVSKKASEVGRAKKYIPSLKNLIQRQTLNVRIIPEAIIQKSSTLICLKWDLGVSFAKGVQQNE